MNTVSGTSKISTIIGSQELLVSNIVHIEGDKDVLVEIDNLKFKFTFKEDSGEPRYSGEINDDVLEFSLYNHKNSLGEGILNPIEVGKLHDRTLSFTYFASSINPSSNARRFEYAFYLGDSK